MAQQSDADVDELPAITKIEYPTNVGPEKDDAVVIWFANDTALRYVWNERSGNIEEQTYVDGVVHSSFDVGHNRNQLEGYALLSVSEYKNDLRNDPEACAFDWGHIYEMLIQD